MTQYEPVCTYYPNRNLVDTITYGNRASVRYEYDDADRVDVIRHRTESTQFLKLDYEYDARGRIDRITETEGGATTEVDYTYDARGRLTREKRCTPDCTGPSQTVYDLEYHYDQGGNRLYKFNHQANRVTEYHYDLGNNRLTEYEVREINGDNVYERVVYDYFHADDKAGNVRRVARKVPDQPGPDPFNWTVYGTDFDYHRNGEVRMIIQRTWRDDGGTVSNDQLVSIHEVRGNGRRRHMLRPWGFEPDGQSGWNTWADNALALWTTYDGDEPTADYRMIDHPTLGTVPYPETSYTLGLAQRTPAGDVKYFHTDHLGTTQAMTDAAHEVDPRIVYTAFGEVINTEGTVDTRYQYVGKDGYETFGGLPFVHIGARWYDPASGRFLQRDPIGVAGGINTYGYVSMRPTSATDSEGFRPDWEVTKDGKPWFGERIADPYAGGGAPLAELFLFATGGEESWLDDKETVRTASYVSWQVCKFATIGALGGISAAPAHVVRGVLIGVGITAVGDLDDLLW